jgi:hypothetical protein
MRALTPHRRTDTAGDPNPRPRHTAFPTDGHVSTLRRVARELSEDPQVHVAVFTEVGDAILPGSGDTERLPRPLGRDRALEAILSSKDYDAGTAERRGWVTRTLPDAELDGFARGRELMPRFEKLVAAKGLEEVELRPGDYLGIARPESR